ncbi:hypothetical protein XENTR_v10019865 [Xenopus tropicalis]|nr:hypothetical protein XENTR_v10019865 [Xenopus tropicalis]
MSQAANNLRGFLARVQSLKRRGEEDALGLEFQEIRAQAGAFHKESDFTTEVGGSPENLKKNRYKDILPCKGHTPVYGQRAVPRCFGHHGIGVNARYPGGGMSPISREWHQWAVSGTWIRTGHNMPEGGAHGVGTSLIHCSAFQTTKPACQSLSCLRKKVPIISMPASLRARIRAAVTLPPRGPSRTPYRISGGWSGSTR